MEKHVIGDIHGNYNEIIRKIEKYNLRGTFYQVGDFGLGFRKKEEDYLWCSTLASFLKERNSKMYVIRGNHDNPSWFTGKSFDDSLFLLKDYTQIDNILFIGGAVSIDRNRRTLNVDYWEDEEIQYHNLLDVKGVEIVISHSSPYYSGLITLPVSDQLITSDTMRERKLLDEYYDILSKNNTIVKWFHGHFHQSFKNRYKGTDFQCLDINEIDLI